MRQRGREGGRDARCNRGANPFVDEGFLYCSDQQPTTPPHTSSFLHPSLLSSLPVYRCSPPSSCFSSHSRLSPFISLPLFLSLSVSPPSPPPSTLFVTFQWGGGIVCCRVQYMHHMGRNASALVTRTVLLQPSFISVAPLLLLHLSCHSFFFFSLLHASKPLSPLAHLSIFQPTLMPVSFCLSLPSLSRMTLIPRLPCY